MGEAPPLTQYAMNDVDKLGLLKVDFLGLSTLTVLRRAAEAMTGFATSVIGCGVEAGIERFLASDETPDGRPGVAVLLFSVSGSELEKQLVRRVGQCVLTCPSTSVFAGLSSEKRMENDGFKHGFCP